MGALAPVALVAVLAGCSGGAVASSGAGQAAGAGVKTFVPAAQRKEPVELAGTTLEGRRLDIATLRGKPVVLNVWGSWCPPCRREAPALQAAATELAGRASFVGIDVRDNRGSALAYQRKFKITYPSIVDPGTLLLSLQGAVAAQSPPVTVVLDAKGRIAARFIGVTTKITLIDMVEDVTKSV
jgi:thiol-disulfide isomerase/thioredoxin